MSKRSSGVGPDDYPAYCFPASRTFNKWVKLTAADLLALQEKRGFQGQNIYFHLNHPIRYVYLTGIVVAFGSPAGFNNPIPWFTILDLDDGSGDTCQVKVVHSLPVQSRRAAADAAQPPMIMRHEVGASLATNEEQSDESTGTADRDGCQDTKPRKHRMLAATRIETTVADLVRIELAFEEPHLELGKHVIDVGTNVKVKGSLELYRGRLQVKAIKMAVIGNLGEEMRIWKDYAQFCNGVLSQPWVLSDRERRRMEQVSIIREEEEARRASRALERAQRHEKKLRAREARKMELELEVERERHAEARELDGNPLDKPGWKPWRD